MKMIYMVYKGIGRPNVHTPEFYTVLAEVNAKLGYTEFLGEGLSILNSSASGGALMASINGYGISNSQLTRLFNAYNAMYADITLATFKTKLTAELGHAPVIVAEGHCFPSGTAILMADGSEKPIEAMLPGDLVLAQDADGDLVPAAVKRLFRNETQEFVRLDFIDGRVLHATPGHRFLTTTGSYEEIGRLMRLSGGRVQLIGWDGEIIATKAELVRLNGERRIYLRAPT